MAPLVRETGIKQLLTDISCDKCHRVLGVGITEVAQEVGLVREDVLEEVTSEQSS